MHVSSAIHVARAPQHMCTACGWRKSRTDSLCTGNILMGPGSCATAPTRCSTPYGLRRQCLSCNRVDGADGALTPTRNKPSFTPRRSGGRDESASHMTTELCACARARGPSRRAGGRTERHCKPFNTAIHRARYRWVRKSASGSRGVTSQYSPHFFPGTLVNRQFNARGASTAACGGGLGRGCPK
jgi:hypothetical protein